MNPQSSLRRVRLTGRAQRWLRLLQDFGHIDDHRIEELLVQLAENGPPSGAEGIVDLPALRRASAVLLFGDGDAQQLRELEKGPLAEDWPFLFS
jgi:hypothetical protein